MWMMMQTEKPDDFVVATGETHPIREFVEKAFAVVGMNITYVTSLHHTALSLYH
jgi:GDPmannose 4,6-dehydratase